MATAVIDALTTAWTVATGSPWAVSVGPLADHLGEDGSGMSVAAASGSGPAPVAERTFSPAVDLRPFDELRFWFRSSRPGDGRPGQPFYLAFEADTQPPQPQPWVWLLPVKGRDGWELHRLWLGDVPVAVRGAVARLRLRSLDPGVAFDAVVDTLLAVRPEPITDADAALAARLDLKHAAMFGGSPAAAIVGPDGAATPPPYLLITPWSVLPRAERAGRGEVLDNPTPDGTYARPAPAEVVFEYRFTAVAPHRAQATALLDAVLRDFTRRPYLVVAGEAVAVTPFRPANEDAAPGSSPAAPRYTSGSLSHWRRAPGGSSRSPYPCCAPGSCRPATRWSGRRCNGPVPHRRNRDGVQHRHQRDRDRRERHPGDRGGADLRRWPPRPDPPRAHREGRPGVEFRAVRRRVRGPRPAVPRGLRG
jgi:hypothetical protein